MTAYETYSRLRNLLKKSPALVRLVNWGRSRGVNKARETLAFEGTKIANDAITAMSETGVRAVLTFGSLLGIVRDGQFMAHDLDVDLLVMMEYGFDWADVERAMGTIGYSKVRYYELDGVVTEQTYEKSGLTVDVFGAMPLGGEMYQLYYYARQRDIVYRNALETSVMTLDLPLSKEFELREVDGYQFQIPVDAERFLACTYGEGWRVPDPNWVAGTMYTLATDRVAKRVDL